MNFHNELEMSEIPRQFMSGDYTVGGICALPETELAVTRAMLDEKYFFQNKHEQYSFYLPS